MISPQYNRKGSLGTNLPYHFGDLVARLRWNGRHYGHVADVHPVFAFENRAVPVDVVEAFSEIVIVFLRTLAHAAGTVPLTRPAPGSFVEGNAENREIRMHVVQIRNVGRPQKRADTHKRRHCLAERCWRTKTH